MTGRSTRQGHLFVLGPAFVFLVLFTGCGRAPSKPPFDLMIAGGRVLDGTGRPSFIADVAVSGGRVAAIGRLDRSRAGRVLEAEGLAVAPGFIDIHTHCDRDIVDLPLAENYIRQGVTTVIGGNCGSHPYPIRDVFRQAAARGFCPNWGLLAGHNTIRNRIMGYRGAPPTSDEMRRMKALVEEEMRSGALGFSTGLSYLPGVYSTADEVIELAGVAGRLGGIYATHLRDQGEHIDDAIREAVAVGLRNRMPVEISHIKLADEAVWGRRDLILGPLEEARRRGVEATLDIYPYTATSTGFTSSFPSWSFEGGPGRFAERLRDPSTLARIRAYVKDRRFKSARGLNKLRAVLIANCPKFPQYAGLNLEQILRKMGKEPTPDAAVDLLIELERNGGATGIFFQMDESDIEALIRLPSVMIGSDGGLTVFGSGSPHPRHYGTFPRVIGRYVTDKPLLTLEEAVRKMTSLPARVLRLRDRGLLREGMAADIVVFDPASFRDGATYQNPHRYNPGLASVLVNGEVVFEEGRHTGKRPGRVLNGPGKRASAS
jgi:N-acyl-D-amino-acid deacylase